MTAPLQISTGQYSDGGCKALNQDFHGLLVPKEPLLSLKGIAVAIADGISSSDVSQVASETAVKSFIEDYYATADSWSVKTSVQRVLQATNSWLYAQTRKGPNRFDIERGYVCTFTAMVIKSATAHLFHAGDTRIYRLAQGSLEQLTQDHRTWLPEGNSVLSRALGMRDRLELDYQTHAVEAGDTFVLATDGVYEHAEPNFVAAAIGEHAQNLELAAKRIVEAAIVAGSTDNLTVQIVRIDQVPSHSALELQQHATTLSPPPQLGARMEFEGYKIVREMYHSNRSHVYLAVDEQTAKNVVLKVPSVETLDNEMLRDAFLMEEWVARRLDNAHLVKAYEANRKRNHLFTVTEYIEGKTLAQWMRDNPAPDIDSVRKIIVQVARGLQAMHRQEMLHQDLRPNNIMIDTSGCVKIIDFGSAHVAGISELGSTTDEPPILGTLLFTAPEYFLGEPATPASDIYSLGVITYQLLCGQLPYGTNMAKTASRSAQNKLAYRSVLDDKRTIPVWIDGAIKKAVQPNPLKRYTELSEFIYDIHYPNQKFLREHQPLIERNPLLFWKGLCFALATALVVSVASQIGDLGL